MSTGINKSVILTEHISCDCKWEFAGKKYNSNQKWNKDSVDVIAKIQSSMY